MSSLRFLCQIYEMSRVLFCNTLVYIILLHCVTSHSYSDKRINLLEGSMIHRYQSENPNPNLVLSFHFQVGKSNKIIQSCAKVKKGAKWMMTSLLDAWLYFRGSWGDCLVWEDRTVEDEDCTTCGQADAPHWEKAKVGGTPAEPEGKNDQKGCAGEGSRWCCCLSAIEFPEDPKLPERSCGS